MSAKLPEYSVVSPAYGRDYKNEQEAKNAWLSGKDFVLQPHGVYCSIRDSNPGTPIEVRFNKLASVVIVNTP